MTINKSFVVKNGLQVATNLIFTNSTIDSVGIGSTIPAAKLEVKGDFKSDRGLFVGIVTATDFNSTSDASLKRDIHNIKNALELLKELNGVQFIWKEFETPSAGVIAQDVEKVLPELVNIRADTGTKTVNYSGLIGLLVEAVKELAERVEQLEK
jgi:hypothetical protein